MNLKPSLSLPIFNHVGAVADAMGRECYVVGGYVRDLILERKSKDIDFVTVGNGIEVASAVAATLGKGAHLSVFKNFGTASVHFRGGELEFVGARRESYRRDSRKPIVEDGTLDDDLSRRDLTINALAISVNKDSYGLLIDKFGGIQDISDRMIRTPLDPDVTFSDDPLRMMRAIRFATQLDFRIAPETLASISRNASRIEIISRERITDELSKIMASPRPAMGWKLLSETGLLPFILPELEAMKGVTTVRGRAHKDNFEHTMTVLQRVAEVSDNVWLRWGALLHDIAKPVTKRWDDSIGWTFHNHNYIGSKMIPKIFRRLKLPMGDEMKYVARLVELHMRPIALVEDTVTDSAIRRLLVDASEDIEDLMTLCRADITSRNKEKVARHLENFEHVREKMAEIEARDQLRNWQPPIDGNTIMQVFGIPQSRMVGEIKDYVRENLLLTDTPNDLELATRLMHEKANQMGLSACCTVPNNPSSNP